LGPIPVNLLNSKKDSRIWFSAASRIPSAKFLWLSMEANWELISLKRVEEGDGAELVRFPSVVSRQAVVPSVKARTNIREQNLDIQISFHMGRLVLN
jgi:hypothetical protein